MPKGNRYGVKSRVRKAVQQNNGLDAMLINENNQKQDRPSPTNQLTTPSQIMEDVREIQQAHAVLAYAVHYSLNAQNVA